jgi:hypothetical protein
LVELDPLTVDPDEDVGHLLFIDRRGNLQGDEGVLVQVEEAVEAVGDQLFLLVAQRCPGGQPVDEVVDELAAGSPGRPHVGNVGYPLRIAANGGVRHLEAPVAGPEGDLDLPLSIVIVQNLTSPKHRIQ